MNFSYHSLLTEIKQCQLCRESLPLEPRPVLNFAPEAQILLIGQAPGIKAHDSNTPWNDASGDRLRQWLCFDRDTFYDPQQLAIMPMGFCYPGKGKSGDLPPRKECAPAWHEKVLASLPNLKLTLLVGQYAQQYYLQDKMKLTERCQNWQQYLPKFMVLPHPSPRNNIWLKRNPWFEAEALPAVQQRVTDIMSGG